MSETHRVLLAGATGLVGTQIMHMAGGQDWLRMVALTRREAPMPRGARMDMLVADPAGWPEAVSTVAPEAVICALGTTWSKAGRDEAAFRAVDHDLVLALAQAAKDAGTSTFVLVSSAGADQFGKPFYLRVKGEVEADLTKLRFRRFDILRPGLLRGSRREMRPLEGLAKLISPLTDTLLRGPRRQFRSIDGAVLAKAALQCAREKAQGRFVHDHDGIVRMARRLDGRG